MTITPYKAYAMMIAAALTKPGGIDLMPDERRSEVLYDTLEHLQFTDEMKADLYARLEERLTGTTGYADAVRIIEQALFEVPS
jgi:hypothetical protein